MPALRDVPKVPAHKERPQMPSTEWRRRNYRTTCSKTRTNTVASILERSNRKDSALSITPIDSIRRAIARRNGVADPTVSDGAHGQGGRIENGLFPASHTAEELARIQELSQRNAGGPDSSQATRRRRERDRQPGPIHRMVNAWWNRLLGAVYGGFSTQEAEYEDHATRRDYLWNTLGTAVWGMVFPLLTIVSTQLVGAEEAGKFSIAFVTGTLIMIACNYGVRNFQVSDIDEKTSFASYQLNRWICGALALACGLVYSSARGYDAQMATIGLGVYLYKVIDGIADVYEGRLQQADKLYLAGMSQTLRSVGVIAVFSVALFLTRSMPIAAMAMGIAAIASLVLVTAPLALLETEKSRRMSLREAGHLFIQCAPLFGALFLFNLIESMPKFVMEGTLAYKYQLYFNALFFPAQAILLSIGFIYKPQLLRLSSIWANPRKRRRFDLIIVAVMALIVVITGACAAFMAGPGIPIMSFMYGLNFERYRTLALLMVVAGGVTAAIDFIYAIITVLRHAGDVTKIYLICFAVSVVLPVILIKLLGLMGAVVSYLAIMALLLVLLIIEYAHIRQRIERDRNPYGA
jgi:O-antigen/teichoic acid export membrane protein